MDGRTTTAQLSRTTQAEASQERLSALRALTPTWTWREVEGSFCLFEADLAGAFRVEVEGSAVYLYGHRRDAWLEHWFEGPGEEGLQKALLACRAEIGRRITEMFRVLG